MSGYFKRIATLARREAPRPGAVSHFGPAKPPVSPPVQPATTESSEDVETAAPIAPAVQPAGTHPSLQPEAVSRKTQARPVQTRQSQPSSQGDNHTHEQAPATSAHGEPQTLGETLAADLSRMRLSSAEDRVNGPTQSTLTQARVGRDVGAQPALHPEMVTPKTEAEEVRTASDAGPSRGPAAAYRRATKERSESRTLGETSATDLPERVASPVDDRIAGVASDAGDPAPGPQRPPVASGPFDRMGEPTPNAEPPSQAPVAMPEEQTVAPGLPGPRARPDVEVSIGTVNLSTEPSSEALPPEPKPRPARAALTQSGIWSGGRAFSRSYVRR